MAKRWKLGSCEILINDGAIQASRRSTFKSKSPTSRPHAVAMFVIARINSHKYRLPKRNAEVLRHLLGNLSSTVHARAIAEAIGTSAETVSNSVAELRAVLLLSESGLEISSSQRGYILRVCTT